MLLLNYGSSFKDELIATGAVISVTVLGSFILLGQIFSEPSAESEASQVLGSHNEDTNSIVGAPQTTVVPTNTLQTPAPAVATPAPTPTPIPTQQPSEIEISYGSTQTFETDAYIIEFVEPTLKISTNRIFKMKVILSNKTMIEGVQNVLTGLVTRDGDLITDAAPITVSETHTVLPGEQLTFFASLSVPEETLLEKIFFDPPGEATKTTYNLDPTL